MKLSRIVAGAAVLIPAPALADPMARYAALTQVAVQGCARPAGTREIVVCGRRAADRWRVPLIEYARGDPRAETVSMERNRLASAPVVRCGIGATLRNCGKVGFGVSTNFVASPQLRPLAD